MGNHATPLSFPFNSLRTVEWHRARIQWKLGVYSRAEIVKVANDLGLTR